jgi:hypothetical protein
VRRTRDNPARASFFFKPEISHSLCCLSAVCCLRRSPVPPFLLSVCLHPLLLPATMSIPSQAAARCCRPLVRPSASLRLSSSTYLSQRTPSRRWQSTEAEGGAAPANPKITQIVDQISQLNLMETADLVSSLKVGSAACSFYRLEPGERDCLMLTLNTSPA